MYIYKIDEGYAFLLIDTVYKKFTYLTKNISGLLFFSCGNIVKAKGDSIVVLKSNDKCLSKEMKKIKKNREFYKYRSINCSAKFDPRDQSIYLSDNYD